MFDKVCSDFRGIFSLVRFAFRITVKTIEKLNHNKMLDPLGQAWQNGSALAT